MRPNTIRFAYLFAIGEILFAAFIVMDHGGLDTFHEDVLAFLYAVSHILTIVTFTNLIKKTEGGDE